MERNFERIEINKNEKQRKNAAPNYFIFKTRTQNSVKKEIVSVKKFRLINTVRVK